MMSQKTSHTLGDTLGFQHRSSQLRPEGKLLRSLHPFPPLKWSGGGGVHQILKCPLQH